MLWVSADVTDGEMGHASIKRSNGVLGLQLSL